jgi:membrane protease YdiL (CAAX protease family)
LKSVKLTNSWIILRFLILYTITVGFFGYLGGLLAGVNLADNSNPVPTPIQNFVITLSELAGTFLIVWYVLRYLDKESINSIGLKNIKTRVILTGVLTGFVIMLSGFVLLLLFNQIKIAGTQYKIGSLFINLVVFIAVAFMEEIAIRGYVLRKLMRWTNKYTALIISSVIFSALHAPNPNINFLPLLNLFFAGLLLGIVYIYTKNLWFSIALHFSWNFFQGAIFGFNVSGIEFNSIIIQKIQHNNIWNGGDFGFEGSVLCILMQIAGILIIFNFFRNYSVKPKSG